MPRYRIGLELTIPGVTPEDADRVAREAAEDLAELASEWGRPVLLSLSREAKPPWVMSAVLLRDAVRVPL